jgi:tetratricopeptide (TPR) repeat protein
MWIVFVVAIGLAIARSGAPRFEGFAVYWLVFTLGPTALMSFWFVLVPKASLKLAGNNRDRQRRILQCVVNTPFVGSVKILPRFLLALNNQVAKNYRDAEDLYRSILHDGAGDLDPGFESTVRQHLADTVEAMGRPEEAATERGRAAATLRETKETVLGLQAQGKLLERDHRYAEAYTTFERALALAPEKSKDIRSALMMHLVLSSIQAGRPADTVRWAEAVIGHDPHGQLIDKARRMAAVACANLGRLDDAERHARAAVELAGTAEKRAEALALLADYVMRRGNLDEAERIAREADAVLRGQKRMPWLILGMIEKERGRLEEAIRALEHVNTISPGHVPALNRRAMAVINRDLAILYAEVERADTALELIRQAEPELSADPKRSAMLDASAALVFALCHEREQAHARIASADIGRKEIAEDGTTQRAVLYLLGRAAMALNEPESCERFFHDYLDRLPDPLYRPCAYFHLAECRQAVGDSAVAHELYTKAVSPGFGTRWERLARERLTTLGAAV